MEPVHRTLVGHSVGAPENPEWEKVGKIPDPETLRALVHRVHMEMMSWEGTFLVEKATGVRGLRSVREGPREAVDQTNHFAGLQEQKGVDRDPLSLEEETERPH